MTIPRAAARLAALAVAVGAVAGAVSAQFSSSVTLVEVYATVTTRSGDVVTDLRAADLIRRGEAGQLWRSLFYLRTGMPD